MGEAEQPNSPEQERPDAPGITRRSALIGGALGLRGLVGLGALGEAAAVLASAGSEEPAPISGPPVPEQLRLQFGSDPAREMTVSFTAALRRGPLPRPLLAYSTAPITPENPGRLVELPSEPTPLSLAEPRHGPASTSFTDGRTGETVFHYHAPLTGLDPDTTYHYAVLHRRRPDRSPGLDGAPEPDRSLAGSFRTAPAERAPFRFTAFGDHNLTSVSPFTTLGVMSPGDRGGSPLFHLMLGDLSYADEGLGPEVWQDWARMVSPAARTFPWMPAIGNHEVEPGATSLQGERASAGICGTQYNGPYGSGPYLARFLLPDNGLRNWDENSLQGLFYSFRIGTVLFISLAGNDVIWQTSDFSAAKPARFTGDLRAQDADLALVPDDSRGRPNLQTRWLEQELAAARAAGSGVEMIVVQTHFPVMGISCDMGPRCAWSPLFDRYQVDLVLAGHTHNYLRSFPVRGWDRLSGRAMRSFSNPFGSFLAGARIDTRRPSVATREPLWQDRSAGVPESAWDTSRGTVYLVIGTGGAPATLRDWIDPRTGLMEATVWSDEAEAKNALEDAPWLASYDTSDAYGYGVFDVDPGERPGETAIAFQWFAVPSDIHGVEELPSAPLEKVIFTRRANRRSRAL